MIFIIYESPRTFNSAGQKGIHQEQHKAPGTLQKRGGGGSNPVHMAMLSTGGTKDLRKRYLEVNQIGRL